VPQENICSLGLVGWFVVGWLVNYVQCSSLNNAIICYVVITYKLSFFLIERPIWDKILTPFKFVAYLNNRPM